MLYYIDGYNVTKGDPATRNLSLQKQRDALEERMQAHGSKLLPKGARWRIVWDGSHGAGLDHAAGSSVEYARTPTADDAIVQHVRAANERVGIVTSDQGLARRCKGAATYGVDVLPRERLYAKEATAQGRNGKKHAKGHGRGGGISPEIGIPKGANKINEELKKIWGIE